MGIGTDNLPAAIKNSEILTDADKTALAEVAYIPDIHPSFEDAHVKNIVQYYSINPDEMEKELHSYAQKLLALGKTEDAWQVLLSS